MNIQKKALEIIYEITGIVLKWDKQQLSDKEAMREIVKTLASEAENYEKKKANSIKNRKILAPLAIGVIVFTVFFISDPFSMYNETVLTENSEIRFEQLNEIPVRSDEIPKKLVIEEFDNQTISRLD